MLDLHDLVTLLNKPCYPNKLGSYLCTKGLCDVSMCFLTVRYLITAFKLNFDSKILGITFECIKIQVQNPLKWRIVTNSSQVQLLGMSLHQKNLSSVMPCQDSLSFLNAKKMIKKVHGNKQEAW